MAVQPPATPPKPRSTVPFTVLGVVLAVLGFVSVVLFNGAVTGGGKTPVARTEVVVAAHDIGIRVPIQAADLTLKSIASDSVPPGAFMHVADLKNVVAAVPIAAGHPITANLVANAGDAVFGAQSSFLEIPAGFVALTIPTGEQQGVGGYIQAGDYISLVAVVTGKSGLNARTVYTNVHVIRVGPASSDTTPTSGSNQAPPKVGGLSSSLTVVVTQCEAEYVSWFIANASVRYTLESHTDYQPRDRRPDPACAAVTAAGGVTKEDVARRWPGVFS